MDMHLMDRMERVRQQYAEQDARMHLRTYRKHLRRSEARRGRISSLHGHATASTTTYRGGHQPG